MSNLTPSFNLIMSMEEGDTVVIGGEEFTMGSYFSTLMHTTMFYLYRRVPVSEWPKDKPQTSDGCCVYVRSAADLAGMVKEDLAWMVHKGDFTIS